VKAGKGREKIERQKQEINGKERRKTSGDCKAKHRPVRVSYDKAYFQ